MIASTKEFLVEIFYHSQTTMNFVPLSVAIALIFSPLASIMAYIITYGEYLRHYPDKKQPMKLAFEAALTTFLFFIALSFIAGFLLANIVGSKGL